MQCHQAGTVQNALMPPTIICECVGFRRAFERSFSKIRFQLHNSFWNPFLANTEPPSDLLQWQPCARKLTPRQDEMNQATTGTLVHTDFTCTRNVQCWLFDLWRSFCGLAVFSMLFHAGILNVKHKGDTYNGVLKQNTMRFVGNTIFPVFTCVSHFDPWSHTTFLWKWCY